MPSAVSVYAIPTVDTGFGKTAPPGSFLSKISVWRGDIARIHADAIVNAAGKPLAKGGYVGVAIHKAAGPMLAQECKALGGCAAGEAEITLGYNLPAKHVIHAVGPVGEKPELLASAYRSSLDVAKENGVRTIAFPCISTGMHGYPPAAACKVALQTVEEWMRDNPGYIDRIVFCVFDSASVDTYVSNIRLLYVKTKHTVTYIPVPTTEIEYTA